MSTSKPGKQTLAPVVILEDGSWLTEYEGRTYKLREATFQERKDARNMAREEDPDTPDPTPYLLEIVTQRQTSDGWEPVLASEFLAKSESFAGMLYFEYTRGQAEKVALAKKGLTNSEQTTPSIQKIVTSTPP